MPDYKRKKIKKSLLKRKGHINTNDKIPMTNKRRGNKGVVPEEEIKVVRGAKYKRYQRTKFWITVLAVVSLICLLLTAVLPVGLYENIVNFTSVIGHGSYPTSVSGGTVLNTASNNTHYYVLTDTNIIAYSNSGKIVFDELHGLSNPILSVSDTRALVYDQGGKSVYIYNLNGKIHSLETKNEIITASISKNGDFAVATHSDSYTSVATVYNKSFNEIFVWNSAKEIINNVLVNPSGNRLAVSTFDVISGQFSSKLLILSFESADPLHTLDLNSSLALKIENSGKGISIICNDKYKFLHWSKFSSNELLVSGEINSFRKSKNGLLLTVNRANDRSDNTIVLISKKGEKLSEFKINNTITDIQYNKGRIYSLCDADIKIYDNDGKILKNGSCNYGTEHITVINANTIAAISDSQIIKVDIEKGEN